MKTNYTILVVDDDLAHRTMLRTLLSGWGYGVVDVDDGEKAIFEAHKAPFDLILMDIRMIKVSGLEALAAIRTINPAIPIIIMTAYASVETAVEALKNGAYDYLTKPLDFTGLRLAMERAMEHSHLREENRLLKETLNSRFDRRNMICRSETMTKLLETVAQVAPSDATVLITGKSGTGKEMIAGAIHFNSSRRECPFIKINCAAITETLLESELFGHEKGAFTGADRRKEGKFHQADGGSLFLDEVGEMSLAMQGKLLRVLQEREITPVGGEGTIRIDVRLIAATNRNLARDLESGRFREDLYYRLTVVTMNVPTLRERKEDIPLIAQHYLKLFSEKNNKKIKGFTPQAMDKLLKHDWPGNVRELINTVERGVVLSRSDYLDEEELSLLFRDKTRSEELSRPEDEKAGQSPLKTMERETIVRTLEMAKGNKSEAARRLHITRRTLHKKLKEYGRM